MNRDINKTAEEQLKDFNEEMQMRPNAGDNTAMTTPTLALAQALSELKEQEWKVEYSSFSDAWRIMCNGATLWFGDNECQARYWANKHNKLVRALVECLEKQVELATPKGRIPAFRRQVQAVVAGKLAGVTEGK